MKTLRVDVAIIGAGTAGMAAYRAAAERRAPRALLIEGGPYGTTCARVGCMPSEAAHRRRRRRAQRRRCRRFGVQVPDGVRIDGRAVMERVRRERDRFVGFVVECVERFPPSDAPARPGALRRADHAAGGRPQPRRGAAPSSSPPAPGPTCPPRCARVRDRADRQRRRLRAGTTCPRRGGGRHRRHRPGARPGAAPARRAHDALLRAGSPRPGHRSGGAAR